MPTFFSSAEAQRFLAPNVDFILLKKTIRQHPI
jgi:hypothetical protein